MRGMRETKKLKQMKTNILRGVLSYKKKSKRKKTKLISYRYRSHSSLLYFNVWL